MPSFHCVRCKAEIDRSFKACPHCGEPVTEFLRRYAEEPIDGKYKIVERLGAGGMGEVYKVTHTFLGATRVIKVIRPQIEESADAHERFLREARAATKVQHPNVATLHDFSELPDGSHYMVWEFIDGENLAQRIRARGALPPRYAVRLAIQALQGLEAIHRAGIVHRDISPENLMITREPGGEERVKIIDMGVAKVEDATEQATRAGVFVGKLRYASPEHLGFLPEGEKIDARADLYSLGVVLYEMLAGRPPYEATSPHDYVMLHSRDTQFRPLDLPPDLPGGAQLQAILAKALERDRNKRFASAREFAGALEDVEKTLPDPTTAQTLAIPAPATTDRDTLHRSTVRDGMTDAASTIRTPVPGDIAAPPAGTTDQTTIVAHEETSSAAALIVVAVIAIVAVAAIAFVLLRRSSQPAVPNTPPKTAAAAKAPPPPIKAQTNVEVVSPAPVTTSSVTQPPTTTTAEPAQTSVVTTTTTTPKSTAPATQTTATAPPLRKKRAVQKPAEEIAKAPEPVAPRPAPVPVRTYIDGEGGESNVNEQAVTEARQKLHGVKTVAVRATNPEMLKELTDVLKHRGMTVSESADTVIDFDGTLERLGRGKKRRSAHATISRNGRIVFRYELPAEEYRVGDTPVEAFARVLGDTLPR